MHEVLLRPMPIKNSSFVMLSCNVINAENQGISVECRSSHFSQRFLLPKPDKKPAGVNSKEKYCTHCKKLGIYGRNITREYWESISYNDNELSVTMDGRCDVFHLNNDTLSCTTTVHHEIATRVDSARQYPTLPLTGKAYRAEVNRARSHRTFAEYLCRYINEDQTNWDEWIPYAMFTYNTTPYTAISYTPFELVYGYQATLPPKPWYSYDDYTHELRERLRATHQVAKQYVKEAKTKAKDYADQTIKSVRLK
ncbi:PREDICTED: uncharacterized protein LOC105457834 [Wasmannia auropunctata]|uniref:uncharacterized protein LOC105457834 n=1 Tax=Wasmannia auropunctata TaxID=64793 RepID=UPI0005EF8E07|nr:PREDICTED: uncharacterized protein LOC105457834 [Wasmannia auropunctata]